MKLFVIAALIAVAAAGRLEHLERSYLPPDSSVISARSSFGSGPVNSGSSGFGNSGAFRAAGAGLPRYNAGSFAGATSNQYLPPNHGSSASGASPFSGSHQGFGAQNFRNQPSQQYSVPSNQYGSPQARNSFGASNYQAQQSATSRQYLAPSPFQSTPQQAFDEETGYQYGAPQARSSFGGRSYQAYPQQSAATSRQYLAPSSSPQNPPQQAFDEQTGYQY